MSSVAKPPKIDPKVKSFFQKALFEWYKRERRPLPWRLAPTPYAVTVSEFMCQQTQIATVLPYYERWMNRWPSWEALAKAKEGEVLKLWEGLGYYRRARMLHGLAKHVLNEWNGVLPTDIKELRSLPGIGPYTAGAIASIALGQRTALVDGNVERVLARFFALSWDTGSPAAHKHFWHLAEELLPEKAEMCGDFNQAMMECGARVCTPRQPTCVICPLQNMCLGKTDPHTFSLKKKMDVVREEETLAWIWKDGKIWLTQPAQARRWKEAFRLPFAVGKAKGKKLFKHVYTVTKYRIEATVVDGGKKPPVDEKGAWFSQEEVQRIFLPAPHRKMIEALWPVKPRYS